MAGLSLVLGLLFVGQIDLLASMCNFGALTAFLLLHVAVAWHYRGAGRRVVHGLVPLIGFVIISYVLVNSDIYAKVGGSCWIVLGIAVLVFFKATGRSTELKVAA